MSRVMYVSGIPGSLFSIEGLSMVPRLSGYEEFGAPAVTALCLIMAGLFFSFFSFSSFISSAALRPCDAALSILSFSFSGFLAITFIPLDLSGFMRATPRCSAVLTPVLTFAVSCAIRAVFMKRAAKCGISGVRSGHVKFLPLALTVAGALLLSSLQ
jgi:hypothetical protein